MDERAGAVEFGKQAASAAIHEELDAAPTMWPQSVLILSFNSSHAI